MSKLFKSHGWEWFAIGAVSLVLCYAIFRISGSKPATNPKRAVTSATAPTSSVASNNNYAKPKTVSVAYPEKVDGRAPTLSDLAGALAPVLSFDVASLRLDMQGPTKRLKPLSPKEQLDLVRIVQFPGSHPMLVSCAIGLLSFGGRGNDSIANVLQEFVQQPVDWSMWKNPDDVRDMNMIKTHALEALGYIGTGGAEGFLRKAMSPNGAAELTQTWLPGMPNNFPKPWGTRPGDSPLDGFRARAAEGLGWIGESMGVKEFMLQEMNQEKQSLIKAGRSIGPYYSGIITSLVQMDMIHDMGFDAYMKLSDNVSETDGLDSELNRLKLEYLDKSGYRIPVKLSRANQAR